jgi:hypothetical protein
MTYKSFEQAEPIIKQIRDLCEMKLKIDGEIELGISGYRINQFVLMGMKSFNTIVQAIITEIDLKIKSLEDQLEKI